jgi:hypothetical protein
MKRDDHDPQVYTPPWSPALASGSAGYPLGRIAI